MSNSNLQNRKQFEKGENLMKNITPNRLALYATLLFGVFSFFLSIFVGFLTRSVGFFIAVVLLVLSNSIIFYAIYYIGTEHFIYRKIKLIYKIIRRIKKPHDNRKKRIDMNAPVFDQTEENVLNWIKDNESEIEQLKQMEVYRREYIGNVSHELKTPIFNLQGYLETLLNGGLEDKTINLTYLQKAAQNADRLEEIVRDLETISRHEAGELKLNKNLFKMYDLASEVFDELDMMAKQYHIGLAFKEGSDKNVYVWADRDRIRQVLVNLVTNSIKYGRENGQTWISIYQLDKQVLIEVTDNGPGIEEHHLPRLFERFYRTESSRSRQRGGSGLGLAIAKHIVEAHRQSLHVRSKVDVGTTFGFTLKKK